MPLPAPLRRFKDWTRHWRHRGLLAPLQQANATSRALVLGDAPVVVSLTSYGERVATVHLTLESIAAGRMRPARLVLWIDEAAVLRDPPPPLRRLMSRGLELRPCPNYGPHKKYFPFVAGQSQHTLPLLTADDDMIYPPHWLADVMAAQATSPTDVVAWRARVIALDGDRIAPYAQWPLCTRPEASFRHFATGASGILYPTAMLDGLRAAGDAFMATCPRADDVWLHVQALRQGHAVRQVGPRARAWPCIPGTEDSGLMHANVGGDGNDRQIQLTYGPDDLRRLAGLTPPTA